VSTTAASLNPNPANIGDPVVAIATVTGNGVPTGTVAFTASTGESCTASLSQGAGACDLSFTTGGPRTVTATYSGDQNFAASKSAKITATIDQAKVKLSPASLSFAARKVGTTSPSKPVVLTNSGTEALNLKSVTISGDFALAAGTTCTSGTVLAPAGTCNIVVTFTPTATGTRTGSVQIADNAAMSPQTVALTGTGN